MNYDGPEKQQPQKSAGGGESGPLVAVDERVVSARGGKKIATERTTPVGVLPIRSLDVGPG